MAQVHVSARQVSPEVLDLIRPVTDKALDASALRALAQATVNLELFTIPLYMTAMYSIYGMHQITSQDHAFYKGRLWPGAAATASPDATPSERAFNLVFSVFIEEMLHLQLAANVATAVGVAPTFTSPVLQSPSHEWTCYGPNQTVLPHILDLRDTTTYQNVRVNLGAVTAEQVELFLAIEEPDAAAQAALKPPDQRLHPYFPSVPFEGWTVGKTEADLPLFGTIGAMYQCYWDYMHLRYQDGTCLFDYVFDSNSVQRDIFNVLSVDPKTGADTHRPEYPGFPGLVTASTSSAALPEVGSMLDAITDQGEGSLLVNPPVLTAVEARYLADPANLSFDYPSWTDTGAPAPDGSADEAARTQEGNQDHYERFQDLKTTYLADVVTWASVAPGRIWTAQDLVTPDYDPANPLGLPTPDAIAQALNAMAASSDGHALMSQVVIGAIAGVTTVLDRFWTDPTVGFPNPSMYGSGDRMAICWALFGQAPNLASGAGLGDAPLLHSCQSLDFLTAGDNTCAAPSQFHTCKGSNSCKARGGCGFVQPTKGGGVCGPPQPGGPFSAPGDNKCAAFGGCAVPISASQVYPIDGQMMVFWFDPTNNYQPNNLHDLMPFSEGEKVHDVAYRAFRLAMAKQGGPQPPATPPPPSTIRLVFPPST